MDDLVFSKNLENLSSFNFDPERIFFNNYILSAPDFSGWLGIGMSPLR